MTKTYSATMAEIARLQESAERLRRSEMAGVISRIREAIEVYGLTAADLGLSGAASPQRSAQARTVDAPKALSSVGVPKFRDPKSGKTWTGRGKPPTWIAKAKNRDAFVIGASASAAPVAKASSEPAPRKAPNIGVPKFRDPKSGKTWTGRGKPPNWIAGSKNRETFAISATGAAKPAAAEVAEPAQA